MGNYLGVLFILGVLFFLAVAAERMTRDWPIMVIKNVILRACTTFIVPTWMVHF